LAQARASMSEVDLQRVLDDTRTLKQMQETPDTPEALATIPSLGLDDLDKQNKLIPLVVSDIHGSPVLYHDLFTNGIVYLDLGFNLYTLPQEYLPYMGLFGRALLEMGTAAEDFVKLSQRIGRKTGGIQPATLTAMPLNADQAVAWSLLRAKSTPEQADDMLDILRDILLTVKLDNPERFRQIVLEEKAGKEAGLIPRGHAVVRSRLQAHLNLADWVSEQINGLEYLFFLRRLAEDAENDWPSVLAKLEMIRELLVNRNTMLCNITLDAENWIGFEPKLAAFLAALPAAAPALHQWTPQPGIVPEGLTIPAQVNYVAKGANLYELDYQPHGSIIPVVNYLQTTWLWEQVRVQGGAYGGFCTFDRRSGALAFLSYRDPNLANTLTAYDQTGEFLRKLDLSDSELLKTIVGAIGILDAYQLPDAKGYTSMMRHLVGDSDELRQQMRDEILATTQADFKRLADVLDKVKDKGLVVVLGSLEAIKEIGWLQATKVL
ncbi:MAG: peptidase M16, partial [Anaerolineae bacterium]|nr:peptidase M16 [Anaerolineae bacterium]